MKEKLYIIYINEDTRNIVYTINTKLENRGNYVKHNFIEGVGSYYFFKRNGRIYTGFIANISPSNITYSENDNEAILINNKQQLVSHLIEILEFINN